MGGFGPTLTKTLNHLVQFETFIFHKLLQKSNFFLKYILEHASPF